MSRAFPPKKGPLRSPMKAPLRPALALMNRLRYPQKFFLISALFTLPLALVLYFLIPEIDRRINFTRQELEGTRYLRPVRHLLEHLLQARRLAHANDLPAPRAEMAAQQATIDEDLKAIEAVDHELGAALQTTPLVTRLLQDWQTLRAAMPGQPNDCAGATV